MKLEKLAEKNRIFIEKLQNLPEEQKKSILLVIVIILGLIMGFFWVRSAQKNFSELTKSIGTAVSTITPQNSSTDILQTTTPTNILQTTTPTSTK